jgi:hypothetical protein
LFGYEIELHNLLKDPVSIEVQDHVPVSRHEDIKLKILQVEPKPVEHSELNILEWQADIPSEDKKIIQYEFMIEHPRDVRVVGLID